MGRFIKNNKLGIFGPDIRREVDDFVTYDLHYNFSLANLTGEGSESALLVSVTISPMKTHHGRVWI